MWRYISLLVLGSVCFTDSLEVNRCQTSSGEQAVCQEQHVIAISHVYIASSTRQVDCDDPHLADPNDCKIDDHTITDEFRRACNTKNQCTLKSEIWATQLANKCGAGTQYVHVEYTCVSMKGPSWSLTPSTQPETVTNGEITITSENYPAEMQTFDIYRCMVELPARVTAEIRTLDFTAKSHGSPSSCPYELLSAGTSICSVRSTSYQRINLDTQNGLTTSLRISRLEDQASVRFWILIKASGSASVKVTCQQSTYGPDDRPGDNDGFDDEPAVPAQQAETGKVDLKVVIGGVAACIALFAILVTLLVVLFRRKKEDKEEGENTVEDPPATISGSKDEDYSSQLPAMSYYYADMIGTQSKKGEKRSIRNILKDSLKFRKKPAESVFTLEKPAPTKANTYDSISLKDQRESTSSSRNDVTPEPMESRPQSISDSLSPQPLQEPDHHTHEPPPVTRNSVLARVASINNNPTTSSRSSTSHPNSIQRESANYGRNSVANSPSPLNQHERSHIFNTAPPPMIIQEPSPVTTEPQNRNSNRSLPDPPIPPPLPKPTDEGPVIRTTIPRTPAEEATNTDTWNKTTNTRFPDPPTSPAPVYNYGTSQMEETITPSTEPVLAKSPPSPVSVVPVGLPSALGSQLGRENPPKEIKGLNAHSGDQSPSRDSAHYDVIGSPPPETTFGKAKLNDTLSKLKGKKFHPTASPSNSRPSSKELKDGPSKRFRKSRASGNNTPPVQRRKNKKSGKKMVTFEDDSDSDSSTEDLRPQSSSSVESNPGERVLNMEVMFARPDMLTRTYDRQGLSRADRQITDMDFMY